MVRFTLPANELNHFDLPAVCLVTGSEREVSFHTVHFAGSLVSQAVHGELPFTDVGWRRHRLAALAWIGVQSVASLGTLSGIIALAAGAEGVGAVLLLGTVLLGAGLWLLGVRGRRVVCRRLTPALVQLEVPDASAAEVVDRYRHAGTPIPIPAVPAP